MKKLKNIAITQRLIENNNYYEIRDALDIRWTLLFKSLGYIPILLPTNYDFKKYFDILEISGLILSGGNDLGYLGKDRLSKKRDVFEKNLIKFAIRNNVPILGVCRGMQIVAHYFNGELEKVNGHIGTNHKILADSSSNYKYNLRKLNFVNSYHAYGIRKIPEGFKVSARSEDGLIEAMENPNYDIFCQMWHSERKRPYDKNELMIIKKLFKN